MASTATDHVFSIPFRYLWNTNFAGDLEMISERPNGLARFVGDRQNQILRVLTEENPDFLFGDENQHVWPLVLFGPSGTGKTSLALSIVSDLFDRANPATENSIAFRQTLNGQREKPLVLTAPDFDRRYRAAIQTDSVADFRRRLLKCGGLVIDDVQRLANKTAAQTELLNLIDQMQHRKRPLVVTMDVDPLQADSLIPQLVSRLSRGLSLPVKSPGRSARRIIIHDLCRIHDLQLAADAENLLVDRLTITVPRIVQFFNKLKTVTKTRTTANPEPGVAPLDVDAAMINRMFQRDESDIKKLSKIITNTVAKEYQIKPADLRSDSRKLTIVLARAVAIYLNRKLLGSSFLKIGTAYGHRDHSTIMHAFRKIEKLIAAAENETDETSVATKNTIEKLEQHLTNQFASLIHFE